MCLCRKVEARHDLYVATARSHACRGCRGCSHLPVFVSHNTAHRRPIVRSYLDLDDDLTLVRWLACSVTKALDSLWVL